MYYYYTAQLKWQPKNRIRSTLVLVLTTSSGQTAAMWRQLFHLQLKDHESTYSIGVMLPLPINIELVLVCALG